MDLRDKKIEKLILEINQLLENEAGSLIPLVTKAVRLANLCNDVEHRFLFEVHLNGVEGTIKWPKNQKPRWDVAEAMCDDRRMSLPSGQSDKGISPILSSNWNTSGMA